MVVLNVIGILIVLLVMLGTALNAFASVVGWVNYAHATTNYATNEAVDLAVGSGIHAAVGGCILLAVWLAGAWPL